MASHPDPSDADWNTWATFARHVGDAMRDAGRPTLLTERTRVSEALWALGYRPTQEQVDAVVEADRARYEADRARDRADL